MADRRSIVCWCEECGWEGSMTVPDYLPYEQSSWHGSCQKCARRSSWASVPDGYLWVLDLGVAVDESDPPENWAYRGWHDHCVYEVSGYVPRIGGSKGKTVVVPTGYLVLRGLDW
jgi:hypothetical protein